MTKFISKCKERLANARNNEGGFTLVELIVVIVILAILIGVTVGGVNKYIKTSRENTDVNNAASIQSVVSTFATDEIIYKQDKSGAIDATLSWTEAVAADSIAFESGDFAAAGEDAYMASLLADLLTDGLPKSQTGDGFTLTIKGDGTGTITVKCVANTSAGGAGNNVANNG